MLFSACSKRLTLMFNCLICIFRVETNKKINYSCFSIVVAWRLRPPTAASAADEVETKKYSSSKSNAGGGEGVARNSTMNCEVGKFKQNRLHNTQNGMYRLRYSF